MQEGISNEMIGEGEDELTARVVIDKISLKRSTARALLGSLNYQEVLVHGETAQVVPAIKEIRVKVSLKSQPSVSSFILSRFLDPLTEKTREFLSEKNFL